MLKMEMGISWCKYIIHEKGVVNICPPYILNDPCFDTPLIAILLLLSKKSILSLFKNECAKYHVYARIPGKDNKNMFTFIYCLRIG